MQCIRTALNGVIILKPDVFEDARGYFMETYNRHTFEELGIHMTFVQDNQSFSRQKGTLRGIHFQNDPMAQSKLIRVTRGAVMDVAVDLRKGSPTYKQWAIEELSESNKQMLLLPRGFGHGFLTLTENVEFFYKVDNFYSKAYDRSVRFNDPEIGVAWGVTDPILSEKDLRAPLLCDSDMNFVYRG